MPALLVAAFIAGALTILAPCSLPLLPLALGAAGAQRGVRLAAVLVGFAATFVATTVVLAAVLAAADLTTQPLRLLVALVLAGAGIALVWPRAWDRLVAWSVTRGTRHEAQLVTLPSGTGAARRSVTGDALTGLGFGAGLGLLWAPCTGPVMAPVIAGALVAGPTAGGASIALAFVAGAAIPLAAIAVGGRAIARRLGGMVGVVVLRRGYGLVVLVTALAVATGLDLRLQSALAAPPATAAVVAIAPPDVPLDDLGEAPELAGITAWINSPPLTMASLRGKVVLVHFWTFACINCIHVQPYVKQWYDTYADDGFVVVGVHTPELSFERDLGNVRDAVAEADVRFPWRSTRTSPRGGRGAMVRGRRSTSWTARAGSAMRRGARAATRSPRPSSGSCSPNRGPRQPPGADESACDQPSVPAGRMALIRAPAHAHDLSLEVTPCSNGWSSVLRSRPAAGTRSIGSRRGRHDGASTRSRPRASCRVIA